MGAIHKVYRRISCTSGDLEYSIFNSYFLSNDPYIKVVACLSNFQLILDVLFMNKCCVFNFSTNKFVFSTVNNRNKF